MSIDTRQNRLKKMSSLERLGLPDDIANLVSSLAGPDGGWMNSQVLGANGGFAWGLRGATRQQSITKT